MRVLHLINTLSAGGAERHLLTLCREQRRQGLVPTVACLREHVRGSRSLRPDFEAAGVPVVALRADWRHDWRFVGRLPGLVRGTGAQLVHTHLPRADLGAALARSLLGVPVVASVHHVYRDDWFGPIATPALRWAYRRAARVIAISGRVHGWLIRGLGVPAARIALIPYGIDAAAFASNAPPAGAAAGPVVGSLGRLDRHKNFACLIAALPAVRRAAPGTRLVIGGHDPDGRVGALARLAARLGVADAVRLPGFVDDVPAFLGGLDVFAFASRSEGFGQVTLEAMAAARPVVVSARPPMDEIVLAPETGLLADPDDPADFARAITSLLADPATARARGAAAAARVARHFTAGAMGDRTTTLYAGLGAR